MVRARFEGCVYGRAARGLTGLLQRERFCMMDAVIRIKAFACNPAVLHDDSADHCAGACQSYALFGKLESSPNVLFVVHKFIM